MPGPRGSLPPTSPGPWRTVAPCFPPEGEAGAPLQSAERYAKLRARPRARSFAKQSILTRFIHRPRLTQVRLGLTRPNRTFPRRRTASKVDVLRRAEGPQACGPSAHRRPCRTRRQARKRACHLSRSCRRPRSVPRCGAFLACPDRGAGAPAPPPVSGRLAAPCLGTGGVSSPRLPGARPAPLAVVIANRDPSGCRARPARGTEAARGVAPAPCRITSPGRCPGSYGGPRGPPSGATLVVAKQEPLERSRKARSWLRARGPEGPLALWPVVGVPGWLLCRVAFHGAPLAPRAQQPSRGASAVTSFPPQYARRWAPG